MVARICLDLLRARKVQREESLEASVLESITREPGLIDPDVALRADRVAVSRGAAGGVAGEIRGAAAVARLLTGRIRLGARFARLVLVDGTVGLVVAPRGRLLLLLRLVIRGGKIAEIEAVADPAHLHQVRLAAPDD